MFVLNQCVGRREFRLLHEKRQRLNVEETFVFDERALYICFEDGPVPECFHFSSMFAQGHKMVLTSSVRSRDFPLLFAVKYGSAT